jgi:hypothetical protein
LILGFGTEEELQLLALLVSGAALLILAGPLRIPYPILLVVGGLLLGFAPGVPKVTMPPEVVLVGILPPLLYVSAYPSPRCFSSSLPLPHARGSELRQPPPSQLSYEFRRRDLA